MTIRYAQWAAVAPLLGLLACSDSPTQPSSETLVASHVAVADIENGKPALYIQTPNAALHRVHFDGSAEDLPGNDARVPALADANIIALRSPRWSPDGTQLAFVASTAFDQAEVAVIAADGTHARIVSISSQYVMGDVDWAPDGKSLTYAMSTRAGAGGLELFVSDLQNRTVKQLTSGSGYSGVGGVVRFNTNGSYVYFSKVTGEEPAAPFNAISSIRRVSANGGAIETVISGITGSVQAIERSANAALVMRNTAWPGNGDIPRELARVTFAGSASQSLAASTTLQYAHLTHDDAYAVLLTATKGTNTPYTVAVMPTLGGLPLTVGGVTDASGGMDVRLLKP